MTNTAELAPKPCPACAKSLSSPVHACRICKTEHHLVCWDRQKGCAITKCTEGPAFTAWFDQDPANQLVWIFFLTVVFLGAVALLAHVCVLQQDLPRPYLYACLAMVVLGFLWRLIVMVRRYRLAVKYEQTMRS